MTADDATTGDSVQARTEHTDTAVDEQVERGVEHGDGEPVVPVKPGSPPGWKSALIRLLASPLRVLTGAVLLSVGLATGLYFAANRPDSLTDSAVARSVLKAASSGATAVLSYAPVSLDSDLAAAKSYLTGEFLAYYSKFSDEVLRPTAQQKRITTKATVVQAAVSELHPDAAKVLVFVNQLSTSEQKPMVAMGTGVVVSLTKVRGTWLISAFEPV